MQFAGKERMGRHEPATDQRTWELCQEVTAKHNRFATRVRKHNSILTGLLVCEACGNHHTQTINRQKKKRYYHCKSAANCTQPYIPQQNLERQITAIIQDIQLTESFVERVVAKVRKLFGKAVSAHERDRTVLLRRQSMLEQRRNIAEDKLLSGVISDEAFRRQSPRIVSELKEISRKLQDIDAGRNLDTEGLRQILLFARDIPSAYSQAPRRLKRIYLEFFFKEIVLRDKQIVRIEPTEFFAALQAGKQVRTFSNWRRR